MTEIINLTYYPHPGMFKYPSDTEPEFLFTRASVVEKPLQVTSEEGTPLSQTSIKKYQSARVSLSYSNHHGTHIDAPAHKLPNGKTIDQYNDSRFLNWTGMLDLTETDLLTRSKRRIELSDLVGFDFNRFPLISALIIYTGFSDEMKEFEGKLKGDEKIAFEKTFPYLSEEAAHHLSSYRLSLVGIDSFAIDPSGSNSESHRQLLGRDILILETLFNLGELKKLYPNEQFQLYSPPTKIPGADAGNVVATVLEVKNGQFR